MNRLGAGRFLTSGAALGLAGGLMLTRRCGDARSVGGMPDGLLASGGAGLAEVASALIAGELTAEAFLADDGVEGLDDISAKAFLGLTSTFLAWVAVAEWVESVTAGTCLALLGEEAVGRVGADDEAAGLFGEDFEGWVNARRRASFCASSMPFAVRALSMPCLWRMAVLWRTELSV